MASWRLARPGDDDDLVRMCLALYAEDPSPERISDAQVRHTLDTLRLSPGRGRALVLDAEGQPAGYALLISFWSNELGGEICTLDELYVEPRYRSRGHVTRLVTSLRDGADGLWPGHPVALELEITPTNQRARALYQRLGFSVKRNATLRLRRLG